MQYRKKFLKETGFNMDEDNYTTMLHRYIEWIDEKFISASKQIEVYKKLLINHEKIEKNYEEQLSMYEDACGTGKDHV